MANKTTGQQQNSNQQTPPPIMPTDQTKGHLAAMSNTQKRMRRQLGKTS